MAPADPMQQPPAYGAPPAADMMQQQQPAPYAGMNYGAPQAMQPMGAQMQPYAGAAPTGPKGQTRNPIMVLLLTYVTCGLYGLIAYWTMLNELKAFLNSDEIQPIYMFIPILQLLMIFKLPGWVTEAKRRAGVPNGEASNIVLYLLLGPFALAKDLNEVWNPTGQLNA